MYTSSNYYPSKTAFPIHIALIPDGGRRWAKKHNCSVKESYAISMKKITQFIDSAFSSGTVYFSVYMASTFNFKRTAQEVDDFCEIEWDYICNDFLKYAERNKIKVRIVGTSDNNMKPYLKKKELVEKSTSDGEKTVYFCFNYNSFDEIENALKKSTVTNSFFADCLDITCPVNMLIRTGGANLLSCFLLPQVAFARLFFREQLFNDFSTKDFEDCINEYISYELKYGE